MRIYCKNCKYFYIDSTIEGIKAGEQIVHQYCIHPSNVLLNYNGKIKSVKETLTKLNNDWNCLTYEEEKWWKKWWKLYII